MKIPITYLILLNAYIINAATLKNSHNQQNTITTNRSIVAAKTSPKANKNVKMTFIENPSNSKTKSNKVKESKSFTQNVKISSNNKIIKTSQINNKNKIKNNALVCPKENKNKFSLFTQICRSDKDCSGLKPDGKCCLANNIKICVKGIIKPIIIEEPHNAIFGIIPQKCPRHPLAELWWDLKVCNSDKDCWPRICCPDGQQKYCRTATPEYKMAPNSIRKPIEFLREYLECTPAPSNVFDVHPKPCNSTFDCFPNVCCQEAGFKFCRPPRKSILTLLTNLLNLELVKTLTKNLVIK